MVCLLAVGKSVYRSLATILMNRFELDFEMGAGSGFQEAFGQIGLPCWSWPRAKGRPLWVLALFVWCSLNSAIFWCALEIWVKNCLIIQNSGWRRYRKYQSLIIVYTKQSLRIITQLNRELIALKKKPCTRSRLDYLVVGHKWVKGSSRSHNSCIASFHVTIVWQSKINSNRTEGKTVTTSFRNERDKFDL